MLAGEGRDDDMSEASPGGLPIRPRALVILALVGLIAAIGIAAAGATLGAALVGGTIGAFVTGGVSWYEVRRRVPPERRSAITRVMLTSATVFLILIVVVFLAAR